MEPIIIIIIIIIPSEWTWHVCSELCREKNSELLPQSSSCPCPCSSAALKLVQHQIFTLFFSAQTFFSELKSKTNFLFSGFRSWETSSGWVAEGRTVPSSVRAAVSSIHDCEAQADERKIPVLVAYFKINPTMILDSFAMTLSLLAVFILKKHFPRIPLLFIILISKWSLTSFFYQFITSMI